MNVEKDINTLTIDEIEEMEEQGTVEIEINDGKVESVKLTDADNNKIIEVMRAMSEEEQAVAATVIKDVVLWGEIDRRYNKFKNTLKRVHQALSS